MYVCVHVHIYVCVWVCTYVCPCEMNMRLKSDVQYCYTNIIIIVLSWANHFHRYLMLWSRRSAFENLFWSTKKRWKNQKNQKKKEKNADIIKTYTRRRQLDVRVISVGEGNYAAKGTSPLGQSMMFAHLTTAVLCLWPPAGRPPWGSSRSACSAPGRPVPPPT